MRFETSGAVARVVGPAQASPNEPRQPLLFSPDDAASSGKRAFSNFRILIVEDDYLIAFDLETALTDAGLNVIGVAASAEDAIALAASHSPSVVIMDIRLAGPRDGIDAALELFRKHGIRCVFASAHSDDDARRRAAPANPLGWIEKPYSVATIVELIARLGGDSP
jgi:DNA-binding NarL/FixJ family response regulator